MPSTGRDTHFASVYGAFAYGGRRKATALLNAEDRDWKPVFHPIIRTHPETGRKELYFDPARS